MLDQRDRYSIQMLQCLCMHHLIDDHTTIDECARHVEISDRMRGYVVFITFEPGISETPFALLHPIIESPVQILRRRNGRDRDPSSAALCY